MLFQAFPYFPDNQPEMYSSSGFKERALECVHDV